MSFTYTQLDPAHSEARLLTIYPDRSLLSDVICTLRIASLDDKPKFEALSYVWGNSREQKTILVNGTQLPVSVRLESALRHLRRAKAKRTLWVDAICINQADTDEKNFQIPLMKRLYADSKAVFVWLGEVSDKIGYAVMWSKTYNLNGIPAVSFPALGWRIVDFLASFTAKGRMAKNRRILNAFEGSLEVRMNPYWARLWTFQEYHLPKKEPVCLCGQNTFRASLLKGATGIELDLRAIRAQRELHHYYGLSIDAYMAEIQTKAASANQNAPSWD